MRILILSALLVITATPGVAAAQQASHATASVGARVIVAPDDPIGQGAVGAVRDDESDEWTVTTGVRDGHADEYRVRLARRDADANARLSAWQPALAGEVVFRATANIAASEGEWLDLTVEHTES